MKALKMNLFTGIILYLIIWWTTLFMVLPWGVRRQDNPPLGTDPGAPEFTGLKKKVVINTLLAFIVWLCIYGAIKAELVPFREIAHDMAK